MSSARKPRYALFSVGKNKASPARNASIKRASLRASVIRTEAPKLHLAFADAGEADANGCKPPAAANAAPIPTTRDNTRPHRESSPDNMKDAPLPSLPDDPAPARKPSQLAFHAPPDARPPRPPPTSRMPPPARQPGPSRPPHHSATMPQPRPSPQQGNFFRRLTSKIRPSSNSNHAQHSQTQPARDVPQRKGTVLRMPSMPKPPPPVSAPNDFTSAEQRQAALRARGLIPASSTAQHRFRNAEGFMMTLSEQEAEIDKRYTVVIPRTSSSEDEDASGSEARKIREAWLAKQQAAGGVSSTDASSSGHDDTGASDDGSPRTSDAIARASKDGMVRDRSPMRATFVRASTLSSNMGEISLGGGHGSPPPGSPLEATVEDFHTAPNTPANFEDAANARQSASADRPRAASPPASTHARVSSNSPTTAAARTHSQEPSTPSSHSSAVTEKVSRWLRTSSDTPASPTASSSSPTASQALPSPLSESPKQSLDETPTPTPTPLASTTPTGTVRTRKEKPPPIIVTAHRATPDSLSRPKVPQAAQVLALAIAAPSDSEASTSSEGRPSLSLDTNPPAHTATQTETRGRGLHVSTTTTTGPPRLAHDTSSSSSGTAVTGTSSGTATSGSGTGSGSTTTSGRSRTNTVPALSPTRTVSSSGASSSLPTPTTTSCAPTRDASISRGSTSHSSDGGHETTTHVRARRGMAGEMQLHLHQKAKAQGQGPVSRAGGVIMEEYSETEPSSEGGEGEGEFGVRTGTGTATLPPPRLPAQQQQGGAVPRPNGRAQVLEAQTKANNRISFSLFGKKSLDSQMPRDTRTSSSMMNLRRAFTSSKPRPKSTLELSPVAEQGPGAPSRKKSKMFDASHLPMSPTFPQSQSQSQSQGQGQGRGQGVMRHHHATSSVSSEGRTTGVGLRPRQAVAPTMHSRGSILHQAHFIEDEESRRLSEMAFLT